MKIVSGSDFENFMKKLNYQNVGRGWLLERSRKRNRNFRVKGIGISATLTNYVVGKIIDSDINLLILMDVNKNNPDDKFMDAIELLYLHEIFVFNLGSLWIFNVLDGLKLVATVLSGSIQHVSPYENKDGLFLNYSTVINSIGIFKRFQSPLFWYKTSTLMRKKVSNLMYIPKLNHSDIKICWDYEPEIIITNSLNSEVIDSLINNNIILTWLHKNDILNELARDLMYYFKKYIRNEIKFLDNRVVVVKINGLDGI